MIFSGVGGRGVGVGVGGKVVLKEGRERGCCYVCKWVRGVI